jgi:predicted RNase H-like HicB family nuclease
VAAQHDEVSVRGSGPPDQSAIRTAQELPGHRDVTTTLIYTHVLNRGPAAVRSGPALVVYLWSGRHRLLIAFKVEIEQEDDGRWLAEVVDLPGVLAYGDTQQAALAKVQALALRVIAEQLDHGETAPDLLSISFNAA